MPPMPVTEYTCQHCNHTFQRVTTNGDDSGQSCPNCISEDVKASIQPTAQFDGISNFIALAKETN